MARNIYPGLTMQDGKDRQLAPFPDFSFSKNFYNIKTFFLSLKTSVVQGDCVQSLRKMETGCWLSLFSRSQLYHGNAVKSPG